MFRESSQSIMNKLDLSANTIAERLLQLDFLPEDHDRLARVWPAVEVELDGFARGLYARFERFPFLKAILANEARVAKLIDMQKRYLKQLFCDTIDENYISERITIGLVHHRIRVTPQWYMATYAHFLCEHVSILMDKADTPQEGVESVIAMMKQIFFDAALVLDAYGLSEVSSARQKQRPESDLSANWRHPVSDEKALDFDRGKSSRGITRIHLSDEEPLQRAEFIGLNEQDVSNLRSLQSLFTEIVPYILTDFYAYLQKTPAFSSLFTAAQIERLMHQVSSYWQEFVTSDFDRSYAASRMRIGVIHEKLGVSPQSYLAGLARQFAGILRRVTDRIEQPNETIKTLFRALIFDVTFIIDAYMEARVEALLRTEGYASQLMTGLNAAVVIVDPRTRIMYANDNFVTLTGINPALLYMMRFEDAIHFPEVTEALGQVVDRKTNRITLVAQWSQSSYRISVLELEEPEESHAQVFAIVLDDISNLLRISGTMEEDEENFQKLSNAVPAVLWEIDTASNTIVMISQQSLDVTGFRDVYFLGRPNAWQYQIIETDRSRFNHALDNTMRVANVVCEYQMRHSNGSLTWLRSHLTKHKGNVRSRVVAVTVDISDAKLAEKNRMAALTLLAGGVSHSLNNSLTAISNNIELHALESSNGGRSAHLERALQAGQRASTIISNLQSFSGGHFLQPKILSLNQLIRDTIASLKSTIGDVLFDLKLADDLWFVSVDEQRMVGVLEQVCFNALQATNEGRIQISTQNITPDLLGSTDPGFGQSWVEIVVEDDGVGMDSHILSRAIDPFFTTKGKFNNDGLGLSMVYGFITQSGGHLILSSQPGEGTLIRMRIPKVKGEFPPDSLATGKNARKVLVVDDDEDVANSTSLLLRQLGYEVESVPDSKSAMLWIALHGPDILLTDLVLNDGIDGYRLAVNATDENPRLCAILMSGHLGRQELQELPKYKFPFLPKPFTRKQLDEILTSSLQAKI